MPRNKPADPVGVEDNQSTVGDKSIPTESAPDGKAADAMPDAKRSKWVTRFGSSGDYQAGVHLIEDRQNRRMLIKFDEKPSEEVRALLKSREYGYRFDGEDLAWYKKISPAKPRQCREEAEELAIKAANIIRQEKGLELRATSSLAM